jgi:translocation and assembly module TamB
LIRFLVAIALTLLALPAFAQANAEDEKSYFTSFLENQISTPNRQIRISGIQGALSSNATIGEITIADREGIWLRIENASIVWSRAALLLRQRLEIETLSAESIEVLRKPLPEEGLPPAESSGFQIPRLPIAVNLGQLSVASLKFGRDVFGLESQLSLNGSLKLEDGSLDTNLDIKRLDGPGGELKLAAAYADETKVLNVDLALTEPQNGVLANLLNIEGRPPLSLTLKGSGPLDTLDLALNLELDGQPTLQGQAQLRRRQEGLGFQVNLSGPVARLVPAQFRPFFGDETRLAANGVAKDAGGFALDDLQLTSAALKLQASAETGADNFLRRLSLDASLQNPGGEKVILPVPGGETTVGRGHFTLDFGGGTGQDWSGRLDIADLTTGTFAAETVAIDLGGLAQNLNDAQHRRITFNADGAIEGIIAEKADVAKALGKRIALDVSGDWRAGQAISLEKAEISGNGLSVARAGDIQDYTYVGKIVVKAASITPFSGLAGRDLSGSLDLQANGKVEPISGAFDLTLDSRAEELRIGNEAADNLLGGTTTITGRVARSEEGLRADDLKVENEQFQLSADGTFASGEADFDFDATLSDLALVSPQASGRLTAHGSAKGNNGRVALKFKADVPSGSLAGKKLTQASIGFDGMLQAGTVDGTVSGDAFLDGVRATLSTKVAIADGTRRLSDLAFTAGGAKATGGVTQDRDGLLEGEITIEAPDISTAAALFLLDASGSVNAHVVLSKADDKQNAKIDGSIADLRAGSVKVGSADIRAEAEDLFGVPIVEGSIEARDVVAGGVEVENLQANATRSGETTDFSAEAHLANGADIATAGSLTPQDQGFRLRLDRLQLTRGRLAARLTNPATLDIQGSNFSFDTVTLDVAGGRLTARGEIAEDYDVSVEIEKLPLSIANAIKPDLELSGTIDGTARVTGPRAKPQVAFDLSADAISAAALKQAGLSSIDVKAKGTTTNEVLQVNARITSPEGLNAAVEGNVPLGEGALALDVKLDAFPLAVLNGVVKGQDLRGSITGSANVGGTLAAPRASFSLTGSGISARPIADLGAGPLEVSAKGTYRDGALSLETATVRGPQGLSVTARGSVPLAGNGLDVNVSATAPLSLANRALAERGAVVEGSLRADIHLGGSIKNPVVGGSFSTAGARAFDPQTNTRIESINVSGAIFGNTVSIRSATAALAAGGRISASGTISTNADAGFPADIRIRLDHARYADGELVATTVSGSLAVTGGLTHDPLLSGNLTLERTEITIPSGFGGGPASIDVKHIHTPPAVQRTLERARADDGTPMPTARPSLLHLDVRISAPARIFVRGRGLDAELGGQVRLTGPITDIQPVGGFELIRGRLSILGKRITFDEGTVTLVGDLDPFVNFVARSESGDITVFITVAGRVSDPKITFTSQPELPQDEVLARLIFNRGIDELSPFQIARLAAAAAELAGGGGTSLLDQIRGAAGLDDLDIVTDAEGNTAVTAGRYIQDNIYLGVEAGSGGTTKGTINLDITEDLKAKGSIGSNGDSSVGIFYEKDY